MHDTVLRRCAGSDLKIVDTMAKRPHLKPISRPIAEAPRQTRPESHRLEGRVSPYSRAPHRQRASMDTSKHRDEIGTPNDVRSQCAGGADNENARNWDVSNENRRTKPSVGEDIPDGAIRLFLDTRDSPCTV